MVQKIARDGVGVKVESRTSLLPVLTGRRWRTAPDEGQQQGRTIGLNLVAPRPEPAAAPHRPRGSCREKRLRDAVSSPPEEAGEEGSGLLLSPIFGGEDVARAQARTQRQVRGSRMLRTGREKRTAQAAAPHRPPSACREEAAARGGLLSPSKRGEESPVADAPNRTARDRFPAAPPWSLYPWRCGVALPPQSRVWGI